MTWSILFCALVTARLDSGSLTGNTCSITCLNCSSVTVCAVSCATSAAKSSAVGVHEGQGLAHVW